MQFHIIFGHHYSQVYAQKSKKPEQVDNIQKDKISTQRLNKIEK